MKPEAGAEDGLAAGELDMVFAVFRDKGGRETEGAARLEERCKNQTVVERIFDSKNMNGW